MPTAGVAEIAKFSWKDPFIAHCFILSPHSEEISPTSSPLNIYFIIVGIITIITWKPPLIAHCFLVAHNSIFLQNLFNNFPWFRFGMFVGWHTTYNYNTLAFPANSKSDQQFRSYRTMPGKKNKVLERPNMWYIFEKQGIQGYQIWHPCVSTAPQFMTIWQSVHNISWGANVLWPSWFMIILVMTIMIRDHACHDHHCHPRHDHQLSTTGACSAVKSRRSEPKPLGQHSFATNRTTSFPTWSDHDHDDNYDTC